MKAMGRIVTMHLMGANKLGFRTIWYLGIIQMFGIKVIFAIRKVI